jgi:uncharacterized protein YdeI (YjbR/CyaY-like superfamily)
MPPVFFKNQAEFRQWLDLHHLTGKELIVGYYTVKSGKDSMTWSQSVDVALCYGWIDGIRRSIDSESYCIRFTPRRPGSNWSQVNLNKVEALIKAGLMHKAGLDVYQQRKKDPSNYSYEIRIPVALDGEMEKLFKENRTAWKFFLSKAPSYRKTVIRWIMSAKQEVTRMKRLNELIQACGSGENVSVMQTNAGKKN